MRPRNINLSMVVPIDIMGVTKLQNVPIAKLKIVKLVDQIKPVTELTCPKCGAVPKHYEGYDCGGTMPNGEPCGAKYGHWSHLKKIVKATGEWIKAERLIAEKEEIHAHLWKMKREDFAQYTDGTANEYGVTVSDEMGALNLKKLLIASQMLDYVIIVTYNDTFQQTISLLTASEANTVILREILPLNLAEVRETLKVKFGGLTERDIEEAKAFVNRLPEATEEQLIVHDYRTIGIEERKVVSEKVQDLTTILEKIKVEAK